MHHYDARVIADQATGRPLVGIRATLLDAETQTVVQAYRDGVPVTLVSGAHGLIGEFETEETTRRVHVTAGPVRLTMWCSEIMGGAQDAAERAEAAVAEATWPKGALVDANLNALTTPGTYWQSTASLATVARGYPAEGGIGVLTVEQFASSIYMQRFTRIGLDGWLETFVRTVAPGKPGEWASEARAATSGGPTSSPIRLTTAEDSDFTALAPGMYYVPFGSHATALGLPVADHGLLIVHHYGGTTGGAWFYPRSGAGVWKRAKNSGTWGPWENIIPEHIKLTTATDTDFSKLEPRPYYVPFGSHATALGLPVADHGFLTVYHYGTQSGAAWFMPRTAAGLWKRAKNGGTWGPWENVIPEPAPAVTMDAALRHQHIATRHAARIGAPINVGTATPIAFVWDDYPAAMRDKGVVAAAREFSIPINAALCSRTLTDRAEKLGGVGITWAEIDAWAADGAVEITHHGQTHDYRVTDLRAEIVTGLEELRGHCPSAEITTWVTPANAWEGFDEGRTADNWASPAGQLIHAHHAYAMGRDYVLGADHSVPMTGTPIPGQGRMWVEAVGMTMDARKKRVTDMYGTGRGAVLAAHAEWIGQEGRWTAAEVRAFFEWLRAEEDAGRIKLMHLSRWAWARTGSTPAN
ncbi:pyocin knob domain-containing protein [Micrococcus sp. NPDC078436]|uniref:pyocin knob domain-containing protein n=1 Tax=Micrococcus sp. NPDC078436 TaxID=3154960 RepID=UPI00344DB0B0